MSQLIQTAIFGQLVRFFSGGRRFRYPDEIAPSLSEQLYAESLAQGHRGNGDIEAEGTVAQLETHEKSPDDMAPYIVIVDWYGPNDPENPQNWSPAVKHLIMVQMCLLNFGVYITSSIYVPGEASLMEEFHVSELVATLGLSLFTLGYGVGPMLWSPLSEMPPLGRTGIFLGTLLGFILFQLPVGFAPNITVFLVFRWVTGFCGSPCLSTGGGTITDIYPPSQVPYYLCIWSWAGVLGPIFGPIVGGYLAPAMDWRWCIWVVTWLCSFVFLLMFFFFPETSAANILYTRAKRLRARTGDDRLKSQTEIDTASHTTRDHLTLLSRAFTLAFTEPIVFLIDAYAGLLYGILFTWFESFPLVFDTIYHLTPGQQGLVYFGILIFTALTAPLFLLWLNKRLIPTMKNGTFTPEMLLPPTFIGAVSLPVCLFWFGWASRESVHWIVPVIGSGFFAIGVVTLFNSVYMYIGIVYTRYAASVFAGAALFRAAMGATFPLFARPLFTRLGIGGGNSLLGGIAIAFIPVPVIFYQYGKIIRGWSKYAG